MQRIIVIIAILAACQAGPQKEVAVKHNSPSPTLRPKPQASSNNTFEITTLQSANGWGYQIRQNDKLLLDQPVIPGRLGNAGFQTQADAQRVAELVKTKLQAKVFPPTVSEDDLKNLNIH